MKTFLLLALRRLQQMSRIDHFPTLMHGRGCRMHHLWWRFYWLSFDPPEEQ